MVRYRCCGLLLLTVSALVAQDQTKADIPSKAEIVELLDKADQKISAYEDAVKAAKPVLEEIGQGSITNPMEGASTARTFIKTLRRDGPSAYALVGLLATLDDMSFRAANAGVVLVKMARGRPSVEKAFLLITNSGAACNDIAELIYHATMRLIWAEEEILGMHGQFSNKK